MLELIEAKWDKANYFTKSQLKSAIIRTTKNWNLENLNEQDIIQGCEDIWGKMAAKGWNNEEIVLSFILSSSDFIKTVEM